MDLDTLWTDLRSAWDGAQGAYARAPLLPEAYRPGEPERELAAQAAQQACAALRRLADALAPTGTPQPPAPASCAAAQTWGSEQRLHALAGALHAGGIGPGTLVAWVFPPYGGTEESRDDLAGRLAAAWNACEGVSTENLLPHDLRTLIMDLDELGRYAGRLRQSVRSLLEMQEPRYNSAERDAVREVALELISQREEL